MLDTAGTYPYLRIYAIPKTTHNEGYRNKELHTVRDQLKPNKNLLLDFPGLTVNHKEHKTPVSYENKDDLIH